MAFVRFAVCTAVGAGMFARQAFSANHLAALAIFGQATNFAVVVVLRALFVVNFGNAPVITGVEAHAIMLATVRTTFGHSIYQLVVTRLTDAVVVLVATIIAALEFDSTVKVVPLIQ